MDVNNLALYLGLLVGDGHISNRKNGYGYPTYSINFFNTKLDFVKLFSNLNSELFKKDGKISCRSRINRKDLYQFSIYSRELFDLIVNDYGIPVGKKSHIVRIPKFILNSDILSKKQFFLGLFLSDGFINKKGIVGFHMASKMLLLDMVKLISEVWKFEKSVREVIQREKYFSYQLNLNKAESKHILEDLCRDHITWYCTGLESRARKGIWVQIPVSAYKLLKKV